MVEKSLLNPSSEDKSSKLLSHNFLPLPETSYFGTPNCVVRWLKKNPMEIITLQLNMGMASSNFLKYPTTTIMYLWSWAKVGWHSIKSDAHFQKGLAVMTGEWSTGCSFLTGEFFTISALLDNVYTIFKHRMKKVSNMEDFLGSLQYKKVINEA